jgi:hypothetical protein
VAELSPHPLVTAIGANLGAPGTALESAGKSFAGADTSAFTAKRDTKAAQDVADAFATDNHRPKLVTFAGFLGGKVEDKSQVSWQVVYRDTNLDTWLLVLESDIVFRDTLRDDRMPFRELDEIWLRDDTVVTEGSGPLQPDEIQARQLRGAFTAAGAAAAASLTGDASSAPETGVYCGGGCTRRSFV